MKISPENTQCFQKNIHQTSLNSLIVFLKKRKGFYANDYNIDEACRKITARRKDAQH